MYLPAFAYMCVRKFVAFVARLPKRRTDLKSVP
nr:MAG TPA: hypothetical protein [Caudoviricetes sp.]